MVAPVNVRHEQRPRADLLACSYVAYQVLGDGPIDIVVLAMAGSNVELSWDDPGTARFFRRLASFGRLSNRR